LGVLALSVAYQTAHKTIFPSVTRTSQQEIITVDDKLVANFKIYNPNEEPRLYTYAVYIDDEKRFENKVTINPRRNFAFGGSYKGLEPGPVKVTALVYEGDKERLIENITYFVTVKPD
jgi:hypothetical protein